MGENNFRIQSDIIKNQTNFYELAEKEKFEGIEEMIYEFMYYLSNVTHNENIWGRITVDPESFASFINYTVKHLNRKPQDHLLEKYDHRVENEKSKTLFEYMLFKLGQGIPMRNKENPNQIDFIRVISELEYYSTPIKTKRPGKPKIKRTYEIKISNEFKKKTIGSFVIADKGVLRTLTVDHNSTYNTLYLFLKQVKAALYYKLIANEKDLDQFVGKKLIGKINYAVLFKKADRESNLTIEDIEDFTDKTLEKKEKELKRKQFKNKKDSLNRTLKKMKNKLSSADLEIIDWRKATSQEVRNEYGKTEASCYYFCFEITKAYNEEMKNESNRSLHHFSNYFYQFIRDKYTDLGEKLPFNKWIAKEENKNTILFDIKAEYKESFGTQISQNNLYIMYERISGIKMDANSKVFEYDTILNEIKEYLKSIIDKQDYIVFFDPLKATKLENNVLTILSPSKFVIEEIENRFIKPFKQAIEQTNKKLKIEYTIEV